MLRVDLETTKRNNSYDNHNYNNCKGNRNNNIDRKQARLSIVMTLRFIHDYAQRGESTFWKWLGMRSCVRRRRACSRCMVLLSELEVQDKPRITRRSRQMEWQEVLVLKIRVKASHARAGGCAEELQLDGGGVCASESV